MYNDRLKWASFPRWSKTGIGNFVLPGPWLCSLKRWFILINFSIFSDFAIAFSWAGITLNFLTAFVQGASLQKSLAKPSCIYSDEALFPPRSTVGVYITFWVYISPNLGIWGAPLPLDHHLYVSSCIRDQLEWADGNRDCCCSVCSWERCSSTFMFSAPPSSR